MAQTGAPGGDSMRIGVVPDAPYPRKLRSALSWPIRRVLDPRFDATVHAVDYRLGSFDGARPSIHHRLDELEVKLEVKLENMAKEQRANAEALEAILERLRRLSPPPN